VNFGIPNTAMNRALASTVASRIGADAKMVAATAAFWRLLGLGGLLLLAGAGAGLAFYGYSYATDQRAANDRLATALADALNKVTLKTDGSVKLDSTGSTVKLDSHAAAVALDTRGGVVRLDSSGLAGSRPTEQQLAPDAKPVSNAKPVTDYTVFKTVQFGEGEVVTGWTFKSSEDSLPSRQYCYYTHESTTDDNMSLRYNIAIDGTRMPSGRGMPVNIEQAFANCVWFGSGHRT
jgi:hypothetical protein